MKIRLDNLIVEVTRKCNMECRHCLRGPMQDGKWDLDIAGLLKDVIFIQTITFTGGEPSLPDGVRVMEDTLKAVKELGIDVAAFYVVTNGKSVSEDFLRVCASWYLYTIQCGYGYDEYSGLALSKDNYHEPVGPCVGQMLGMFSFFRPQDKEVDFQKILLINEGRALSMSAYKREPYYKLPKFYQEEDVFDVEIGHEEIGWENELYISLNGEVRVSCECAYENTVETIGNVKNRSLLEILKSFSLNADRTRQLYKKAHGKMYIPLKSGRCLSINTIYVEEDPKYEDLNVGDVLEVSLLEKDGTPVKAYRTLDPCGLDHAAQLAVCLLLDYKEQMRD